MIWVNFQSHFHSLTNMSQRFSFVKYPDIDLRSEGRKVRAHSLWWQFISIIYNKNDKHSEYGDSQHKRGINKPVDITLLMN